VIGKGVVLRPNRCFPKIVRSCSCSCSCSSLVCWRWRNRRRRTTTRTIERIETRNFLIVLVVPVVLGLLAVKKSTTTTITTTIGRRAPECGSMEEGIKRDALLTRALRLAGASPYLGDDADPPTRRYADTFPLCLPTF
jgi:hypothetical protein